MAHEIPDYVAIGKRALARLQTQGAVPEPQSRLTPTHPLEPIEAVLKGNAIELWSDLAGERLWLVVDQADAVRLGRLRGQFYTIAEAWMVCQIEDPAIVQEILQWKARFDAVPAHDDARKSGCR